MPTTASNNSCEPRPAHAALIAVLGMGTMGAPMAANLQRAGHRVRAYNRSGEGRARALSLGLEVCETPAVAAAQADVIVCCVADDEATRACLIEGPHAALATARSGAILVDAGTTSAALTRELDARARARGLAFADAPVTGSKLGAEGGTLTFIVGTDHETMLRLRPILGATARHIVHAGPVGRGQAAKLALNAAQAVILEGVLEGYALARALGVPVETMAEVFDNSAGRTGVGAFKTPYLLRGDLSPHFKLALMHKDLRLAAEASEGVSLDLPLVSRVQQIYASAEGEGWGNDDFLATARLLGLGDVQPRAAND